MRWAFIGLAAAAIIDSRSLVPQPPQTFQHTHGIQTAAGKGADALPKQGKSQAVPIQQVLNASEPRSQPSSAAKVVMTAIALRPTLATSRQEGALQGNPAERARNVEIQSRRAQYRRYVSARLGKRKAASVSIHSGHKKRRSLRKRRQREDFED